MKIRPLYDRIIVKRVDAEEKTRGGLIIPDTAKEESQCPYCNKNFPSGQIMVHKLNCPKNPTK